MPAASDGLGLVLPHTWRPLGPRIVGAILGVGVLVLFVASWYTFPPETRAKFTAFQLGTIFFLTGLGATCMYALTRSRAVARRERTTHAARVVVHVVDGFDPTMRLAAQAHRAACHRLRHALLLASAGNVVPLSV